MVTEGATGTMQAATDSSTVLVDTPYTISFENTVKYFKPAVSFRVKVSYRYYLDSHSVPKYFNVLIVLMNHPLGASKL